MKICAGRASNDQQPLTAHSFNAVLEQINQKRVNDIICIACSVTEEVTRTSHNLTGQP